MTGRGGSDFGHAQAWCPMFPRQRGHRLSTASAGTNRIVLPNGADINADTRTVVSDHNRSFSFEANGLPHIQLNGAGVATNYQVASDFLGLSNTPSIFTPSKPTNDPSEAQLVFEVQQTSSSRRRFTVGGQYLRDRDQNNLSYDSQRIKFTTSLRSWTAIPVSVTGELRLYVNRARVGTVAASGRFTRIQTIPRVLARDM